MGYLKVYGQEISVYNLSPALALSILGHMSWNTMAEINLGLLSLFIIIVWPAAQIYFVNKLAREALLDEQYWGFAQGYAPIERPKMG